MLQLDPKVRVHPATVCLGSLALREAGTLTQPSGEAIRERFCGRKLQPQSSFCIILTLQTRIWTRGAGVLPASLTQLPL